MKIILWVVTVAAFFAALVIFYAGGMDRLKPVHRRNAFWLAVAFFLGVFASRDLTLSDGSGADAQEPSSSTVPDSAQGALKLPPELAKADRWPQFKAFWKKAKTSGRLSIPQALAMHDELAKMLGFKDGTQLRQELREFNPAYAVGPVGFESRLSPLGFVLASIAIDSIDYPCSSITMTTRMGPPQQCMEMELYFRMRNRWLDPFISSCIKGIISPADGDIALRTWERHVLQCVMLNLWDSEQSDIGDSAPLVGQVCDGHICTAPGLKGEYTRSCNSAADGKSLDRPEEYLDHQLADAKQELSETLNQGLCSKTGKTERAAEISRMRDSLENLCTRLKAKAVELQAHRPQLAKLIQELEQ